MRKALTQFADIGPENYRQKFDWRVDPLHINQQQAQLYFDWSNLVEFVFVREPLDRLISLYTYTKRNFESFEQFMIAVKNHFDEPSVFKEIFNSQLHWITDNTVILKYENLIKDTKLEFAKINLPIYSIDKLNITEKSKYIPNNKEKEFCLQFLSNEYDRLEYTKP